jgi:hypothetical protein
MRGLLDTKGYGFFPYTLTHGTGDFKMLTNDKTIRNVGGGVTEGHLLDIPKVLWSFTYSIFYA